MLVKPPGWCPTLIQLVSEYRYWGLPSVIRSGNTSALYDADKEISNDAHHDDGGEAQQSHLPALRHPKVIERLPTSSTDQTVRDTTQFFLVNLKHGSVPMHACGPSSKPLLVLGAQSVHPDRRAQLLTSYVFCCDKAVGLFR
jgi:hypothetical protein